MQLLSIRLVGIEPLVSILEVHKLMNIFLDTWSI